MVSCDVLSNMVEYHLLNSNHPHSNQQPTTSSRQFWKTLRMSAPTGIDGEYNLSKNKRAIYSPARTRTKNGNRRLVIRFRRRKNVKYRSQIQFSTIRFGRKTCSELNFAQNCGNNCSSNNDARRRIFFMMERTSDPATWKCHAAVRRERVCSSSFAQNLLHCMHTHCTHIQICDAAAAFLCVSMSRLR